MALLAIGIVKNARRSDRAAQRANVAAPAPQAGPSGPQRSPARIFWKFLPGVIVAAGIAAALFAVGIWYVLFGSPYDPFWQSGAICADYVYQEEAAEMFAIAPRSAPDLDQNRNGVACDEAGLPSRDAQLAHPGQTIPPVATPATVGGAVGDLALTARPAGGDRSLRIELAGLEPLAHKGSDRLADRRTFGRVCTRYLSFERIAASVQATFASPVWIEPEPGSTRYWVWFQGQTDRGPYLLNEAIARSGSARVTAAGARSQYGTRLAQAEAAARTDATGFWGSCGASIPPRQTALAARPRSGSAPAIPTNAAPEPSPR